MTHNRYKHYQNDTPEPHIFESDHQYISRSMLGRRRETESNQRQHNRQISIRTRDIVRSEPEGDIEEPQPRMISDSDSGDFQSYTGFLQIPSDVATYRSRISRSWSVRRFSGLRRSQSPNTATLRVSPPLENLIARPARDVEETVERRTSDRSPENDRARTLVNIRDEESATVEANESTMAPLPSFSTHFRNNFIDFANSAGKKPNKNWISRFKNIQQGNKKPRRKSYSAAITRSSKRSPYGWGFSSRKAELKKLGIELSYAGVTRADWKLNNLTAPFFQMGRVKRPKPGSSNLRYCLTYSNEIHATNHHSDEEKKTGWISLIDTACTAAFAIRF